MKALKKLDRMGSADVDLAESRTGTAVGGLEEVQYEYTACLGLVERANSIETLVAHMWYEDKNFYLKGNETKEAMKMEVSAKKLFQKA